MPDPPGFIRTMDDTMGGETQTLHGAPTDM
jgi:hypothetical protein